MYQIMDNLLANFTATPTQSTPRPESSEDLSASIVRTRTGDQSVQVMTGSEPVNNLTITLGIGNETMHWGFKALTYNLQTIKVDELDAHEVSRLAIPVGNPDGHHNNVQKKARLFEIRGTLGNGEKLHIQFHKTKALTNTPDSVVVCPPTMPKFVRTAGRFARNFIHATRVSFKASSRPGLRHTAARMARKHTK